MSIIDIEALKRWAKDLLSPAGDIGGPFVMTNHSARELGRELWSLIKERESFLNLAGQLRRERNALKENQELADVAIESLIQERDSLKAQIDAGAPSSRAFVELSQERDSLKKKVEEIAEVLLLCAEEKVQLRVERDSIGAERDQLRELSKRPLFQFAIELDRMNREAARKFGGGVA